MLRWWISHFRFPNRLPEELKAVKPVQSHFITEKEAAVLDEINFKDCNAAFGPQNFTVNDLVVKVDEFREFFELVSDCMIPKRAVELGLTQGGWLQINNTVSIIYQWYVLGWSIFSFLLTGTELDASSICCRFARMFGQIISNTSRMKWSVWPLKLFPNLKMCWKLQQVKDSCPPLMSFVNRPAELFRLILILC